MFSISVDTLHGGWSAMRLIGANHKLGEHYGLKRHLWPPPYWLQVREPRTWSFMRSNGPYFLFSLFHCCLLSFCPQSKMPKYTNLTNREQISHPTFRLEPNSVRYQTQVPLRPRERTHRSDPASEHTDFLPEMTQNKKQISYWVLLIRIQLY